MSRASPTPSLLRRWLPLLVRLVVAAGLLVLLFSKVPWRDRVVLSSTEGEVLEFPVEQVASEIGDGRTLLVGLDDGSGWRFDIAPGSSVPTRIRPPEEGHAEAWASATVEYSPGLLGGLERISVTTFVSAFLLALAGTITASARWKVLLGAVGLAVPLGRTLRLNLAGLAASQVLLGSVGGDVVKGTLVTRDEAVPASLPARTSAVLALLMDRIVGLVALLAIGTTAALLVGGELHQLGTWFGGALAALLAGLVIALVVASRTKLPSGASPLWRVLHSLHRTLGEYRHQPAALAAGVALSFLSHSLLILAIADLGHGLGMGLTAGRFFLLIPIVETTQAVPISIAGWGVAESMYVVLFRDAGETASLALSLALSVRAVTLSQALLGVPGLITLLRQQRQPASSAPSSDEAPELV